MIKYEIYHTFGITGTEDISSYVFNSTAIPIIITNDDHSISGEGFSFDISASYDNDKIREAKLVWIYIDGIKKYYGMVDAIEDNANNYSFKIRVVSYVQYVLSRIKLEHSKLNDDIIAGTSSQYIASDNFGYPNVQLLYLLEVIFKQTDGVFITNIDTSDLVGQIIAYQKEVYIDDLGGTWVARDFVFEDLRVDVNMLWATNQDKAISYNAIDDPEKDFSKDKITLWDYLTEVFKIFSLFLFYDNDTYFIKRIITNDSPTIAPTNVYDSKQISKEPKEEEWMFSLTSDGDRSSFTNITEGTLEVVYHQGDGEFLNLTWYNNLVFLLDNEDLAPGQVHDFAERAGGILRNFITMADKDETGYIINMRPYSSLIFQLETQEVITEITLDTKQWFSNYINPIDEESIIKTGGYE